MGGAIISMEFSLAHPIHYAYAEQYNVYLTERWNTSHGKTDQLGTRRSANFILFECMYRIEYTQRTNYKHV